jgi:predicted kinase
VIHFKHLLDVLKYDVYFPLYFLLNIFFKIQAAKEALDNGKSVVVDNTNPSADTRSEYIALAKSHKIPCRCFILNTPIELCHHLNYVRVHQTSGDVRRIPGMSKNNDFIHY